MDFEIRRYSLINIEVSDAEEKPVRRAVRSLRRDLRRVLDAHLDVENMDPALTIRIFTRPFTEEESALLCGHKESFRIRLSGRILSVRGNDSRGTIYGIYDVCQNILGVSPWYFMADVPVHMKHKICIPGGYLKEDYPDVEYRGIFINDEEELDKWAQRYMGEETIGVKTYEHIFELLLRLKMNYIWPAMHVNSFNMDPENGRLADEMGIVVGTSHCDMLMRSNNREWLPWLKKKGYEGAEYDFSTEKNRKILEEYWRESLEQNKGFEVSYTLGMRGIHDSGIEAQAFRNLSGEELREAKKHLLEEIIRTQQKLIRTTVGEKKTLKIFVPYKEVMELYDNGLEVPEDLTLIWTNDNYGFVRRYPSESEKKREGGNGLYYHNSYWSPPGNSYVFICSIPLAQTRNELRKAWREGIRKLWVTNFGAVKPLEMQISFFARCSWYADRKDMETQQEQCFIANWIDQNFQGQHGKELAPLLTEFDQITNCRKLEQMDHDVFSQDAYGNEAAWRIGRYEEMYRIGNRIWKSLPESERDAFFQLVLMKIHAAYWTNLAFYYGDRSFRASMAGDKGSADRAVRYSRGCENARRSMLYYYNHVMSAGKWNGILTPEDYPPPRITMDAACRPYIEELQEKNGQEGRQHSAGPDNPEKKNNGEAGSSSLITLEASVFSSVVPEEKDGWLLIENLGRGRGAVIEAQEKGSRLECEFETSEDGECLIEIHRFPALNSTGRLRAAVSIDDYPQQIAESKSNDEYKGSWLRNVKDGVDKLYLKAPRMKAGRHRITLTSIDKYFGFSRICIYTGGRRENNLGFSCADNGDPEVPELKEEIRRLYGEECLAVYPRPVLVKGPVPPHNVNEMRDYYFEADTGGIAAAAGEILEKAAHPFEKEGPGILIETAAALAGTPDASFENADWDYCCGPFHAGTGLAMYIRKSGLKYTESKEAPSLHYRFACGKEKLLVWVHVKTTNGNTNQFTIGVDGGFERRSGLYDGQALFCFSDEQVWKWMPLKAYELEAGTHTVSFYSFASDFRIDGIWLGEEDALPPVSL